MKQLFTEGLAKMQAGDIDARLSRRPIERYQWPLGAALFCLAASFLIRERKRVRARSCVATAADCLRRPHPGSSWRILSFVATRHRTGPVSTPIDRRNFSEAYQRIQEDAKGTSANRRHG